MKSLQTLTVSFFRRYFGEDKNLFEQPKADQAADPKSMTMDGPDLEELFGQILGSKNLIALSREEVDMLRDLAVRLFDTKAVSKKEAIALLKIAQRARPSGNFIQTKIEELSNPHPQVIR
jgi:hypothetical protein